MEGYTSVLIYELHCTKQVLHHFIIAWLSHCAVSQWTMVKRGIRANFNVRR